MGGRGAGMEALATSKKLAADPSAGDYASMLRFGVFQNCAERRSASDRESRESGEGRMPEPLPVAAPSDETKVENRP